jgi:hypothetical protein
MTRGFDPVFVCEAVRTYAQKKTYAVSESVPVERRKAPHRIIVVVANRYNEMGQVVGLGNYNRFGQ